ncbi:DUF1499 domain-containing protein [Schlegelella sp. S2-27]|uniref:DUF1499 domain-containing protein n=1 Tax=Caldimonas mangrovi TaxID=2944811 RepID=A0ABT0YIW1_9BURK|nr:DUF1499 domain-containing protein [Caldimonas mangrovi]MCM5678167.1 DUF1499 domain-containing protein [Caldimonas mangrovi]
MRVIKWVLVVLAVLALAVFLAARLGFLEGPPPADLGVRDGRLKPPSDTPNSASSQAHRYPGHPMRVYAQVEPLRYTGDPVLAQERLRQTVATMGGARIVTSRPGYLHATFTTRWLRFVDDVEFAFDPAAGVVHVRSASRLGRRDFGVNRERVEAIRERFGG